MPHDVRSAVNVKGPSLRRGDGTEACQLPSIFNGRDPQMCKSVRRERRGRYRATSHRNLTGRIAAQPREKPNPQMSICFSRLHLDTRPNLGNVLYFITQSGAGH